MQKQEDLRIWAPYKFGLMLPRGCFRLFECLAKMLFLMKFRSVLVFDVVLREVGSGCCKNILYLSGCHSTSSWCLVD